MTTEQLVCERDGVPTRLRCAKCEAGICPACGIRTPVGYKCPACAGVGTAHRRRRPAPLVLAGGAVLVALAVLALLRSGPERTTDPVGAQTAGTDGPPTRQAMIGEEARDGQLAFVVDDFGCSSKPPPGPGRLCSLRLTVTNTSTSPASFLGRFQYLVDGQARTYGADEALTRAVPENANRSLSEVTINPDVVVSVVLLFDLPDGVDPVEAQFKGTGRSRIGVNVRLQRR